MAETPVEIPCECGHSAWDHFNKRPFPCGVRDCKCDKFRCAPDSPKCFWQKGISHWGEVCPVHGIAD